MYSFGGQADSSASVCFAGVWSLTSRCRYYEYLIKEHQLLQGAHPQYARMYEDAIEGAYLHLIRSIRAATGVSDLVTIGDVHYKVGKLEGEIDSWYSSRLGQ